MEMKNMQNKYLVIALPVIDYPVKGYGPTEQRVKLHEEIDELREEAEAGKIDIRKLLAEYIDVGQMLAGLIRSQAKETLAGQSVDAVAFDIFYKANTDHLKKMERYAEERGWAILSGNLPQTIVYGNSVTMFNESIHTLPYRPKTC
ncbi:hypothetical protein [Paenibacillus sp. 481]|uniref:hypothetical protein n=1 Tax=Paenibacillus sp. 481 TaxID=2835869 RepID=UPI001E30AED5|nr:hypothetical protein [Paenibacillus sp. 481]UHA74425.1 hypothetical protein KIK04_04775 [Paenibacillus sp. 481]